MEKETGMESWDRGLAALGTKRRKIGRKGLALGALLLAAGVVVAAATIMLSNTSKNTATIVSLAGDWTAVGTLGSSYFAGVPTAAPDTNINTCTSGVCADYTHNTARDYASLGFTQIDFLVVFSNMTASDFTALSGLWLPSTDPCTLGTYTNPIQPAISGYGCMKAYTSGNFGSLPAQGAKGQWELAFTISEGTVAPTMQMFSWVQGVK